jgi:hypothetical protein
MDWINPWLVPPGPPDEKIAVIEIDRSILTKLRPAAVARDCSVNRLVRQLLDRIAVDNLTGAILDD